MKCPYCGESTRHGFCGMCERVTIHAAPALVSWQCAACLNDNVLPDGAACSCGALHPGSERIMSERKARAVGVLIDMCALDDCEHPCLACLPALEAIAELLRGGR